VFYDDVSDRFYLFVIKLIDWLVGWLIDLDFCVCLDHNQTNRQFGQRLKVGLARMLTRSV